MGLGHRNFRGDAILPITVTLYEKKKKKSLADLIKDVEMGGYPGGL